MLLGIGGVRALRLWSRLTGAPAPDVYHTNEGHAGFLGVERIRELTSLRPDDLRRGARGGARRDRVHHAHPGAGRHRPLRRRPDPDLLRRRQRPRRACRSSGCSQLGAEDYAGGEPGVFNMAVMGLRLGAARQRRLPAARRRQPAHVRRAVAGLRRRRGADHQHHQRCPRADLGRPQGLRAGRQAPGHHRPRARQRLGPDRRRPRRRDLGDQARAARAAGQGGPPPGALLVGQARREPRRARLGRRHPRPGRPDHRLRPPGADVQAAHPDAARPRRGSSGCCSTRSGRSSSSSPASPTRPTRPASS